MGKLAVLCFAVAVVLTGFGPRSGWSATLNVGSGETYETIQAAIDAASPGDTIDVLATYKSSTTGETFPIRIDKGLHLLGAQAGSGAAPDPDADPRPSQGGRTGDETIIDGRGTLGHILDIVTADAVEINGFTITGSTDHLVNGAIMDPGGVVELRYNILYDESAGGGKAVQVKYADDSVIEYNYAYNISSDAFCLSECNNGIVQYNEAHDIHSEDAAIFCYGTDNASIVGNLVYNVPNNDGIKLGASWSHSTGGSVTGNEVHDAAQDGITIYSTGALVDDNLVYNCSSENGAMYLYRAHNTTVTGNVIAHNDAIGLLIKSSSGVTVVDNQIIANSDDDTVYPGSAGIWLASSTIATSVHNNRIHCNSGFGLRNDTVSPVNATNNWWGDPSGPAHASNPSGLGDAVSDNVDYDPWLGYSVGDFNFDCSVDLLDYSIFTAAWQGEPGDAHWNPICHIASPCSGTIDIRDLAAFAASWLEQSSVCE